MENQEFNGKVAIITGATSGIGRATARKLASGGAKIVAIGRNETALQSLHDELQTIDSINVKIIRADVSIETKTRDIITQTIESFGAIDILVNAAGIISNGTIENTSLEDWDAMMNINVRSVFNLMNLATPHLKQNKGNIVNVSSVTGLRAFPGVLAYCVSKAAVDQLTRCSALELAAFGVRVNAVNPGVVVTDLHKRGGMNDENYTAFLERSGQTHPLGRVGEAHEIADLICYLASEKASWITGATYSIDGGRAQTCAR